MSYRDPLLRRLPLIYFEAITNDVATKTCLGVLQAEQVIRLEGQGREMESCADVPAHRSVRLLEVHFARSGQMCLQYSRFPFVQVQNVIVSVDTTISSLGRTVRTFPLHASNFV